MPDIITNHLDLIRVIGGLLGLFLGGEALVRGAVALADKLGIPKLVIGLTIVGFGTSLPELLVALQAVNQGVPDIAIGNIIGSNLANLLLILAAGALILPIATKARSLRRDALVMLAATGGLIWLAWQGTVSRLDGMVLVIILAVYLLSVILLEPKNRPNDPLPAAKLSVLSASLWLIGGLIALVFGADCLVSGASAIARQMGVSEAVIGLTLVALGTSLPELTVSVISALRGQNEVSLGNVIGSNIFNILGILGITAWVHPLVVGPQFLRADLPVLGVASLLVALLILRGKPVGRVFALLCLATYALYCGWLVLGADGIAALFTRFGPLISWPR